MDDFALNSAAVDAACRHMSRSLFAVAIGSPKGSFAVGSGVGIRVGDRFFIATAGHNLHETRDEGYLGIAHTESWSKERVSFLSRWPFPGEREHPLDVGYIELAPDVAIKLQREFLPLTRLRVGCVHDPDSHAFMMGYHSQLTSPDMVRRRKVQFGSGGYLTYTIDPSSIELEPGKVAVGYPRTGFEMYFGSIDRPHPSGLSGSGIWLDPKVDETQLWTPDLMRLIGIETGWLEKKSRVHGYEIRAFLALIAEHFEELRVHLADRLSTS